MSLSLDEDDSGAAESGLENESTLKLSMEDGDGDYGVSLDEGDADTGLDAGSTLELSTQDEDDSGLSIDEEEGDTASRTELALKLKARTRLGEDAKQKKKPLPPRTPEEQARYEQLKVLPFGTWLEFVTNQQGDVVRRRLSWFSPLTDNALFVNQRGQRVGEQSLDSVARMLASGQARIVVAGHARLVDRAWQAAMHALRSFAGLGDKDAEGAGAPA